MMLIYIPIQLYLVDAFQYAASALAAAAVRPPAPRGPQGAVLTPRFAQVFRSLFGFAFPLFGEQLFATLGVGGGNTLLAGIGIVVGVPFPIWIYYKGEGMRARSKLTR